MEKFEMVAKTLKGLEEVLAEELRNLGAENVLPGRRMVSFEGDKAMLYKANLCCRTALRILKPFYKFTATTPDELYERVKDYDWSTMLDIDKTFCIDTVAYSDDFTHTHYVTYKVKDAIVDWFRDHNADHRRPGVRLQDADVMINVHISGGNVTMSLDSSGESLHKRGYRVAQTEAPINEVLAAGIILLSGWRGDTPLVDPMCGSGTFLIEAALIAANINPGIYRKSFAFEAWPDFDRELFESIYNDDEHERTPKYKIYGADISPKAIEIATENIKSAGVAKYIELETKPLAHWESAPQPAGVMVTNPPYGQRISAPDMEGLYSMIGNRLKNAFQGYHAWIIGYKDEYFRFIGLTPSQTIEMLNGSLECELREYVIFEGDKKSFMAAGGRIKEKREERERPFGRERRDDKGKPFGKGRRDGDDKPRRRFDDDKPRSGRPGSDDKPRRRFDDDKPRSGRLGSDDKPRRRFDDDKPRSSRPGSDDKPRRRFDDDKPRAGRFNSDEQPRTNRFEGDRDERPRSFKRDERPQRPFVERTPEPEPENPLAKRRNPEALKMLQGKKPSLPPAEGEGVKMVKRGWRKKKD